MKRKRYWRIHECKPFIKPIELRTMKELDKDIKWCQDVLEEHEHHYHMISEYLAKLLVERTKRYEHRNR